MSTEKIKEAFHKADLDGNGVITKEELRLAFRELGDWSDDDFDALFTNADDNESESLSYDQFVEWLMSSNVDTGALSSLSVKTVMVHQRTDCIKSTTLRCQPTDDADYAPSVVWNGEVVEVLGLQDDYLKVKTDSRHEGWVKEKYLSPPPRMLHRRTDHIPQTSLREEPRDDCCFIKGVSVINNEIVEICPNIDSQCDPSYMRVFLPYVGVFGWLKTKYLIEVPTEDRGDHPRWMLHERRDGIPKTSLRVGPTDDKNFVKGAQAYNGEIVEILQAKDDFLKVKLALSGAEGWIKNSYLRASPEGTRDHARLSTSGGVQRNELKPSDSRFKEVREFLVTTNDHRPAGMIDAERIWFITGHCLGETGMVTGPKETLFHGLKDDAVDSIVNGGFDDAFASAAGAFGAGMYFTPQSCKAFTYSEDYMLLCEVALGAEENRLTVTKSDRTLTYTKLMSMHKRSVQAIAGCPFKHNERMVYHPCQCKPVYLIKLANRGPGGEGKPGGKCP